MCPIYHDLNLGSSNYAPKHSVVNDEEFCLLCYLVDRIVLGRHEDLVQSDSHSNFQTADENFRKNVVCSPQLIMPFYI